MCNFNLIWDLTPIYSYLEENVEYMCNFSAMAILSFFSRAVINILCTLLMWWSVPSMRITKEFYHKITPWLRDTFTLSLLPSNWSLLPIHTNNWRILSLDFTTTKRYTYVFTWSLGSHYLKRILKNKKLQNKKIIHKI
jgi:hypothetical protein